MCAGTSFRSRTTDHLPLRHGCEDFGTRDNKRVGEEKPVEMVLEAFNKDKHEKV